MPLGAADLGLVVQCRYGCLIKVSQKAVVSLLMYVIHSR